MLAVGAVVTDRNGCAYRVEETLGAGGQGTAYGVREQKSHARCVAKIAHANLVTRENAARLDALVAMNLSARSPALAGPFSRLRRRHGLGSVMPRADGEALEDLLGRPPPALVETIALAAAISCAVAHLESFGVAHGDIAPTNIIVDKTADDIFRVHLIDLENAFIPGQPAPPLAGQPMFAAPEVLRGHAVASPEADRFALACVLHEAVLCRHPLLGLVPPDATVDEYVAAIGGARWLDDPRAASASGVAPPGLPVGVLSRDLHELFRRGVNTDPSVRPSANEWARAWTAAAGRVFACNTCQTSFINESTRYACPLCGAAAEMPELRVASASISLATMTVTLGRDDLVDARISREHVTFRRNGFALTVKCLGRNGIAVRRAGGNAWIELSQGEIAEVSAGDQIRFARGVEGTIEERGP